MEPMTHDTPRNRQCVGKLCRCNECGVEAVCTLVTDFYIEAADEDKETAPLYCVGCLMKRANAARKKKLNVIDELFRIAAANDLSVEMTSDGEVGLFFPDGAEVWFKKEADLLKILATLPEKTGVDGLLNVLIGRWRC